MSAFFTHINALLGIHHVTIASRTARSNSLAEAFVKRLSEHLKFYAKDDYSIELVLPLIEMNLRATQHSKMLISPYNVVFADHLRWLCLGILIPSQKQHYRKYRLIDWHTISGCPLNYIDYTTLQKRRVKKFSGMTKYIMTAPTRSPSRFGR